MTVHEFKDCQAIYKCFGLIQTNSQAFYTHIKCSLTGDSVKVTIIGTGYVGLVSGTGLANLGNDVICLDIDKKKIDDLNKGKLPIFEPGLKELCDRNAREGRLSFTTNEKKAIQESQVIFLAVGTPPTEKGDADLKYIESAAKTVAKHINDYKIIINKSTVPVGTADMVKKIIKANMKEKHAFDVVSNPEFLREGAAVKDFENPDRIVLGVDSKKAENIMTTLYKSLARTGRPIMITDTRSSELIKYASNAMLATRISFMNQLSHLYDTTGANIKQVAQGIGLDDRIGPRFLQAGIGYGGSCFPKDVQALIATLKKYKCKSELFDAVHKINERQKLVAIDKLSELVDIKNATIGIWGLSFKPKTDDIRESAAIKVINRLLGLGASVLAFDPEAMDNARESLPEVIFTNRPIDAVKNVDALVLATEWNEFRNPDFEKMKKLMKSPIIVDGRNIYDRKYLEGLGFTYVGIGR